MTENVCSQINQLRENLEITSERIFEENNENFRKEITNRLEKLGFNVSNHNSETIWEVLFQIVNSLVSAKDRNVDLQVDIVPLLKNLRTTSKNTFENEDFRKRIANALNRVGFYTGNDNPETIWKVFRRAVDSSVCAGRNINFGNENTNFQDTKLRLEQMLLTSRTNKCNIANSLDDVLYRPFTQELSAQLTSPQDIANRHFVGIKQNTHIDFVTNLIEKQFSIEWNTGKENLVKNPKEFNFYKFCDVEKLGKKRNTRNVPMEIRRKHLQYEPRRAHVKVQLYRFCRSRPRIEYKTNQLCPSVYIRSRKNWTKWDPVRETFTTVGHSHFNKMSKLIRKYISSHAIKITTDHQQVLTKHTLYWAVVRDKDFRTGNHLKLKRIGNTQVYVGKTNNGIKARWLTADSSHCKMMKRCLDNLQAMTTYDPSRLEGIQLVDARLLLAKLREEECALFVMNTYEGPQASENLKADEIAQINGTLPQNGKRTIELLEKCPDWKPKYMAYGMNKCR